MSGRRDVGAYLEDMIASAERIAVFASGSSDTEIVNPESAVHGAILHELTVLGEAAKQVPPEWTDATPAIPWTSMARMRDKIVHYYWGLDERVLLDAVRSSIPRVIPLLRSLRR